MLSVYDALLVRDFEAATLAIDSNSGCFDFLELHPVHKVPPLMLLVAQAVQHETATSSFSKYRVKEQRAGVVALARAMIDAGADAMQSAPFECQFVMHASTSIHELNEAGEPVEEYTDNDYSEEVMKTIVNDATCAGRSALGLCFAVRDQMQNCKEWEIVGNYPMAIMDGIEPTYHNPWHESRLTLLELSHIFKAAAKARALAKKPPATVAVPEGLISLYEAIRSDSASHDVELICEGGAVVTAHSTFLGFASPALSTMLASGFLEGKTKQIAIRDCAAKSATLFLDMLHTASTTLDLDSEGDAAATLLGTLELAHRWQVPFVVEMAERALTATICDQSFDAIATAAQMKDLPHLKRACRTFAADPKNAIAERLSAKSTSLPLAVRTLLNPTASAAPEQPPAKKRRSF